MINDNSPGRFGLSGGIRLGIPPKENIQMTPVKFILKPKMCKVAVCLVGLPPDDKRQNHI